MSSPFGRKGRNETGGRRRGVAKKSASLLAAVAVAGGAAVAAMPQAEAAIWGSSLYFEKSDENGNPLGGSVWKIQYEEFNPGGYEDGFGFVTYHTYYVVDDSAYEDYSQWENRYEGTGLDWRYEFLKSEYGIEDKSFVYGKSAYPEAETPLHGPDELKQLQPVRDFIENADTSFQPDWWEGESPYWRFGSLSPEGLVENGMERINEPEFIYAETEILEDRDDLPGRIKTDALFGASHNVSIGTPDPRTRRTSDIRIEEVVQPKGHGTCGQSSEKPEASVSLKTSGDYTTIPEIKSVTSTDSLPFTDLNYDGGEVWGDGIAGTYAVTNFVNCKTPEPTTTETTTTPQPETTEPLPSTTTPSATTVAEVKPDAPAVVEQPTPSAPVADTPVATGSLSGTVVWDEGRSRRVEDGYERIPGLAVVALRDGKEVARTTTDENGFYKFDGLEPGEYTIAVYGPDGGRLFFDDKSATVVAGEEDTGNDWGFVRDEDFAAPAPVEEGEATSAVAGEEDADNDSVSARDDSAAAPAPVEEGDEEKATPVETVRMALATTGANSSTLAGLGAVLAALVALAVVGRRKVEHQ